MKTFRQLISEVAQPKSEDELNFKDKHEIDFMDHPESEEHQHTAEKRAPKRLADYKRGEDMSVYESVKFSGKTFTNYKTFNSDREANKFLEKNDDYGVIGTKGGKVYVAKMSDMGESKQDEDEVEENAFIAKAAAAKKDGKKKFKLGDKEFPVTIKQDTAKKIVDESVNLTESTADKMISSLISAISKYSDKREFERAGAIFELWAEKNKNAYKRLVETPGIAGSFFSDLVEVLDIRVDLDESVNELSESNQMAAIGRKLQQMAPKEKNDMISNAMANLGDHLESYGTTFGARNMKELEKKTGLNSNVIKMLIKRAGGSVNESVNLTENFKTGSLTLNDGSRVTISRQNADLLNQMFNDLNPANRREMMKVAMKDKAGFEEILGFAREAL